MKYFTCQQTALQSCCKNSHSRSSVCVYVCVCVWFVHSCPILWDPMESSLPGSSVHGILRSSTVLLNNILSTLLTITLLSVSLMGVKYYLIVLLLGIFLINIAWASLQAHSPFMVSFVWTAYSYNLPIFSCVFF